MKKHCQSLTKLKCDHLEITKLKWENWYHPHGIDKEAVNFLGFFLISINQQPWINFYKISNLQVNFSSFETCL